MSRIFRLPMPEGGAETNSGYFVRPHNCPQAQALKRADKQFFQGCDELHFSVGVAGSGMPANTPFPCESQEPCGACGKVIAAWFEWAAPLIIL